MKKISLKSAVGLVVNLKYVTFWSKSNCKSEIRTEREFVFHVEPYKMCYTISNIHSKSVLVTPDKRLTPRSLEDARSFPYMELIFSGNI